MWEPPAGFDPEVLQAALAAIPSTAWSLPSLFEVTRVHHGYRRVTLPDLAGPFAEVLSVFAPIRDAWVSWIDPGGFIAPHRDGGPYYDRWQVPIRTAGWTEQAMAEEATNGVPFRVRHWLTHSVRNPTGEPRIHLVIDRDVIVNPARDAFCVINKE